MLNLLAEIHFSMFWPASTTQGAFWDKNYGIYDRDKQVFIYFQMVFNYLGVADIA